MERKLLVGLMVPVILGLVTPAGAAASGELHQNQAYAYGLFEARVRFAPGDGVVSSFFLWKVGSEVSGAYWNELDFEKIGADCHLQTNALYGAPVGEHSQITAAGGDLCAEYHTYGFEWTPTSIAWLVDGVERRRETGATAAAFAQNASAGMQIRFNIWPGDASFGGNFNPAIMPVRQYISWVQYSSYVNGTFALQWREEFNGTTLPTGWSTGDWASPKRLSTHTVANVGFVGGIAVLSLTADDATGFSGELPADNATGCASGSGGAGDGGAGSGTGGLSTGGTSTTGGNAGTGGGSSVGGGPGNSSAPGGSPPAGSGTGGSQRP